MVDADRKSAAIYGNAVSTSWMESSNQVARNKSDSDRSKNQCESDPG